MTSIEIFNFHVVREFRFLIDEFGFVGLGTRKPDESGEVRHRYERGHWFITPFYNTYERGVDVEFGNAHHAFSLHMYMSIMNPTRYYELGFGIANDDTDIEPLVHLYSDALRTSGQAILACDESVLDRMARVKKFGEGMCPSYGEQPEGSRIVSQFV